MTDVLFRLFSRLFSIFTDFLCIFTDCFLIPITQKCSKRGQGVSWSIGTINTSTFFSGWSPRILWFKTELLAFDWHFAKWPWILWEDQQINVIFGFSLNFSISLKKKINKNRPIYVEFWGNHFPEPCCRWWFEKSCINNGFYLDVQYYIALK